MEGVFKAIRPLRTSHTMLRWKHVNNCYCIFPSPVRGGRGEEQASILPAPAGGGGRHLQLHDRVEYFQLLWLRQAGRGWNHSGFGKAGGMK